MPRGADPVNDELEVGFSERFEASWARAERVGRLVMMAFIAAALAGLLGRGPFSHRTSSAAGSDMSVDYEPIARAQTDTQITLHIRNPGPAADVDVFVSTKLVEPMGLQRIIPQPLAERVAGDGLVLSFSMPAGTRDGHVRLVVQPAGIGPIEEAARLEGHAPVHWTQLVLP